MEQLLLIGFGMVLAGVIVGKLSSTLVLSWMINLVLSIWAVLWVFDAEFWYLTSLSIGYVYPSTKMTVTVFAIFIMFALTMAGLFLSTLGKK